MAAKKRTKRSSKSGRKDHKGSVRQKIEDEPPDQSDAEERSSLDNMFAEFKKFERLLEGAEISSIGVIGGVPGFAMAQGYLGTAQAQNVLAYNAVAEQKQAATLSLLTTYKCVEQMLSLNEENGIDVLEEQIDRIANDLKDIQSDSTY